MTAANATQHGCHSRAGVAGLSAAYELAKRGFQVTVYERTQTIGGKARSIFVPGSGRGLLAAATIARHGGR